MWKIVAITSSQNLLYSYLDFSQEPIKKLWFNIWQFDFMLKLSDPLNPSLSDHLTDQHKS